MCAGDLCAAPGDIMSARLMVAAGGARLVLRASRDGLVRVAPSPRAGQRQQTRAASAEVGGESLVEDAGTKSTI